jgi:hypothetical protein
MEVIISKEEIIDNYGREMIDMKYNKICRKQNRFMRVRTKKIISNYKV